MIGKEKREQEKTKKRNLVTRSANNVLQVLEEAIFVLILGLGLHLCNRFNLALPQTNKPTINGSAFNHKPNKEAGAGANLEDEETLVIKIDATLLEGISDLGEVAGLVVDIVLALAALGHIAHHNILHIQ